MGADVDGNAIANACKDTGICEYIDEGICEAIDEGIPEVINEGNCEVIGEYTG